MDNSDTGRLAHSRGGTAGMENIDKGRLVHSRIFGYVDTVEPISAVPNEA